MEVACKFVGAYWPDGPIRPKRKYFVVLSDLLHPPPRHLHGKPSTPSAASGESRGLID